MGANSVSGRFNFVPKLAGSGLACVLLYSIKGSWDRLFDTGEIAAGFGGVVIFPADQGHYRGFVI